MSTPKKIALGASAAAVALGVSLGATGMASAATTDPAPTSTSSAPAEATTGDETPMDRKGGSGRGHGGIDAAALATKLGVDEAAVTDALQAARDAAKADAETTEGERPDREALQSAVTAALAEALGLDEANVQTAIDELQAQRTADRSAAVQERLDAAVTDGSLTQAEADGAAKALELGILGGGGRR